MSFKTTRRPASLTVLFLSFVVVALPAAPPVAAPARLKIGLMPAVNAIPLIVGREAGFFAEEGLALDLEMFSNQLYRESALQAGAIDGSVSDLINAVAAAANGQAVRVTSYSEGHFSLLAAPGSKYASLSDLSAAGKGGLKAGLLENSIINFVTDKLLDAAGVPRDRIELIATPQLPVRLELLLAGKLDLACLPEPMTRLAMVRGARLLGDTDRLPSTPGVILFTGPALKVRPAAVRAFYRAYNRAVAELVQRPDRWRPVIVSAGGFPAATRDSLVIPKFAPARVTTREEYREVVDWMLARRMVGSAPPYELVVTGEFLP